MSADLCACASAKAHEAAVKAAESALLELKALRLRLKELEGLAQARNALKELVDLGYLTKEESALIFLGRVGPHPRQGGEIAYAIAQEVADRAKVRESSP